MYSGDLETCCLNKCNKQNQKYRGMFKTQKSRNTTSLGESGLSIKWKRKRSDSVLWQKPLHRQKNAKSNVKTKKPPKTSITQRLRTDLGRSVGVTIATQLVWLKRFTGSQPYNTCKSQSGTGPGFRMSKCPLLTCRTRCKCSMETSRN